MDTKAHFPYSTFCVHVWFRKVGFNSQFQWSCCVLVFIRFSVGKSIPATHHKQKCFKATQDEKKAAFFLLCRELVIA